MTEKKTRTPEDRACDPASVEAIRKAELDCVDLSFFRMDGQKNQCAFGTRGVCCRICHMGPCRITPKSPLGVCGADEDTIVARNFLREVAGGSAAHSDHGRHLVLLLKKIGEGRGGGYALKDEKALRRIARAYGIERARKHGIPHKVLLHTDFKSRQEFDEAMVRTGCNGIAKLMEGNPDTRFTIRCRPVWMDLIRQILPTVEVEDERS